MSGDESRDSGAGILVASSGKLLAEVRAKEILEFQVCWHRPRARWLVRLGDEVCGNYLTKKEALLGAIGSASDAQDTGHDARVWDTTVRVF